MDLKTDKVVTAWHIFFFWVAIAVLPVVLIVYFLFPSHHARLFHEAFDRDAVVSYVVEEPDVAVSDFALILGNSDVFVVEDVKNVERFLTSDGEGVDDSFYKEYGDMLSYRTTLTPLAYWRFWESPAKIIFGET